MVTQAHAPEPVRFHGRARRGMNPLARDGTVYSRDMIPLSRPSLGAEETAAVARVLESGRLVQGERVAEFERAVAERVGRAHAVAVANGTCALRIALEAIGIGADDEVLVPDLTWPSPGHAVLELGGLPVLVDVDAQEWNATPDALAAARTDRTRAAIVIDQFGNPSRSRAVSASLPGLPVIVDAACSLGSHTGSEPCGALGLIACLSFHPRKVLTTGEGGMCLTDDAGLAERLRELRNHGQSRPGVFARSSGNHRMTELAAAIGSVQLTRLDGMIAERNRQADYYLRELSQLPSQRAMPGARRNHQTFGVLLPAGRDRDAVVAQLRQRGIESGRLSYALHALPQFARAAQAAERAGRAFPNASALAERGLALPLWSGLSEADQHKVIEALRHVLD
jgi:perosamine synthetase